MTVETVSIRPADPFAPESLRLIEQLWSELGALYPEANGPPFPPRDIDIVGGSLCFCAGLVGWARRSVAERFVHSRQVIFHGRGGDLRGPRSIRLRLAANELHAFTGVHWRSRGSPSFWRSQGRLERHLARWRPRKLSRALDLRRSSPDFGKGFAKESNFYPLCRWHRG